MSEPGVIDRIVQFFVDNEGKMRNTENNYIIDGQTDDMQTSWLRLNFFSCRL